jgi:CheY-like chemotaxis protein
MSNVALAGCRVLVVEDEVLIGMVLEDILDMLGCSLAGTAATLDEAWGLAEAGGFDVAILDVNIGTDPVYPLADAIMQRGVPIIFATGSLPDSLPERFGSCVVLEKPYVYAGVEAALTRAWPAASTAHPAG